MKLETFIRQMDELTASKTPYLFIIDFDKSKPLLFKLSELEDSSARVKYSFSQHSNVPLPASAPPITESNHFFDILPTSFEHYQQKFDAAQALMKDLKVDVINLTSPTPLVWKEGSLERVFHRAKAKYKVLLEDQFVCCSPEIFVRINPEGIISTYPMKGTIDANIPDAQHKILSCLKEQREHGATVELVRQELSTVAEEISTVRYRYTDRLTTTNKDLFQVSSEVAGVLKSEFRANYGQLMNALLPAGSILGTPREQALQVINQVEGYARGYYTGVCGIFDGEMLDSCVLIRIIEKESDGGLYYKSGGGITLESDAKSEYEELKNKIYVPLD